jgi:hypothetical protein
MSIEDEQLANEAEIEALILELSALRYAHRFSLHLHSTWSCVDFDLM